MRQAGPRVFANVLRTAGGRSQLRNGFRTHKATDDAGVQHQTTARRTCTRTRMPTGTRALAEAQTNKHHTPRTHARTHARMHALTSLTHSLTHSLTQSFSMYAYIYISLSLSLSRSHSRSLSLSLSRSSPCRLSLVGLLVYELYAFSCCSGEHHAQKLHWQRGNPPLNASCSV